MRPTWAERPCLKQNKESKQSGGMVFNNYPRATRPLTAADTSKGPDSAPSEHTSFNLLALHQLGIALSF